MSRSCRHELCSGTLRSKGSPRMVRRLRARSSHLCVPKRIYFGGLGSKKYIRFEAMPPIDLRSHCETTPGHDNELFLIEKFICGQSTQCQEIGGLNVGRLPVCSRMAVNCRLSRPRWRRERNCSPTFSA